MLRKNEQITAREVRIVGDGIESQVLELQEAQSIADELGLDLVEVSPEATPPVCKVIDWSKYLYQTEQKEKSKKKSVAPKTIRLHLDMADNDRRRFVSQAQKFISSGHPLRVNVQLQGREKSRPERARELLSTFLEELQVEAPISTSPAGASTAIQPRGSK